MKVETNTFRQALERSAPDYQIPLNVDALHRLSIYFDIVGKWNHRLHLVAPCSPEEFATRHVLESLLLLPHLPRPAEVTDVGSGAGLPMIPCLIARPDLKATLIESSKKKSVFLRESARETGVTNQATVIAERFEELPGPATRFVSCRALDRFQELLPKLARWTPRPGTLLLFGGEGLQGKLDQQNLGYYRELIPNSDKRFLFVVNLE